MHVETRYFNFWKNLWNYKKIFKSQELFHVLLSTIFYKRSGTFNETCLTLSSLAWNILSKKAAGFCFLINLKFKKVSTSLLASLALPKASRLIVGYPAPSNVILLKVFGVSVLFIYTISISINCVSLEEISLIASNEQIYTFYKWVIFWKKTHCGK